MRKGESLTGFVVQECGIQYFLNFRLILLLIDLPYLAQV